LEKALAAISNTRRPSKKDDAAVAGAHKAETAAFNALFCAIPETPHTLIVWLKYLEVHTLNQGIGFYIDGRGFAAFCWRLQGIIAEMRKTANRRVRAARTGRRAA
jgi:hypothetical protein